MRDIRENVTQHAVASRRCWPTIVSATLPRVPICPTCGDARRGGTLLPEGRHDGQARARAAPRRRSLPGSATTMLGTRAADAGQAGRRRPSTIRWSGATLDGRYRIKARLGQGGVGAVYRGRARRDQARRSRSRCCTQSSPAPTSSTAASSARRRRRQQADPPVVRAASSTSAASSASSRWRRGAQAARHSVSRDGVRARRSRSPIASWRGR